MLYNLVISRINRLGPLAKVGVCLLIVTLLALALQAVCWVVGSDFSALDKSGGSALLMLSALVLLLSLVAIENRPMAEYGLLADRDWARHGLLGFAIGVCVYAGFCAVVAASGVFFVQTAEVTPYRCVKGLLAAMSAFPIAITQQIIFSGFLVSMLRGKHGRLGSVLLPALLFGMACCLSKLNGSNLVDLVPLGVGMILLGTLLGLLRLRMGSIVLGSGLLAGCIAVRKLLSKTHLLGFDPSNDLTDALAPTGDPRQSPVLWCVLAGSSIVVLVSILRYGERLPAENVSVHASFKRIVPFSNLLGFAPLDRWFVVLARARMQIGIVYWPRLVMTLVGSTFNTILSLPERLLAPWLLRHDVPDPVFIVGMPRSGTTHLHNLLALDDQFRTPRNYEVFNPHGFLTGWLTTALMAPLMSWRRPMDAVQMQVFSPQEEEFALASMTKCSPYWAFCVPRQNLKYEQYWHSEGFDQNQRARWGASLQLFLRKLTVWTRKRPLLKNPANTGRLAILKELYPSARFIHIFRHPCAVYRSNRHLAREGFVVFQLQDPRPQDGYEPRILSLYRALMDGLYKEAALCEAGEFAEVRYEDLDSNPLAEIERLYEQLGLEISAEYRQRLMEYLQQQADYRKNKFSRLDENEHEQVASAMAPYFTCWGYEPRFDPELDSAAHRAA